ncbi:MAG: hypothetical protein ABR497_00120 [Kiritimatiellia bacterium]|nr:hypothetical protein [Lentisphaerota bacterium]
MKFSSRELHLTWITGLAALLALTYWMAQPRLEAWLQLREYQQALRDQIMQAERLVAQREEWNGRLRQLHTDITRHPPDRDLSADYLRKLEQLARASNLTLLQRRAQAEKQFGDLFELVIDCTWEGDLEALVRFIFSLETEETVMDMDELTVSLVSGAQGRLKGNFSIICIYARQAPDSQPAAAPPDSAATAPRPHENQIADQQESTGIDKASGEINER